jgi:hypothetical protein
MVVSLFCNFYLDPLVGHDVEYCLNILIDYIFTGFSK